MATQKKSIDDIWKELNAKKPGRSGTMGTVLGGATNMPGVTTLTRTIPNVHAGSSGAAPPPSSPMQIDETTAMEALAARRAAASSASSHYDPARAGVDPEELQAFVSTIQRTINCLSDPDRNTRKQAIAALLTKLTDSGGSTVAVSPPMLQALVCGPLLHPVSAMLHDPGEAARLSAAELMQRAAASVPDFSAALPVLLPEVLRRMGHLPVVEPAEEARLLLTQLVSSIVQG